MLGKGQLVLLFLLAPAVGFFVTFAQSNPVMSFESARLELPLKETADKLSQVQDEVEQTKQVIDESSKLAQEIQEAAKQEKQAYEQHDKSLSELVSSSKESVQKSADVLDHLLTSMLGNPIGQTFGKNATVKVYSLEEAGYRGYMAKVRLNNPNALKVVLANDQVVSNGETTSHAAKRKNAVLAVNAGGFYNVNGKLAVLGTTVVDGEIKAFSNKNDLSFVGFNTSGHLVGGKVTSKEQIKKMNVLQGASFLPTLLQNGKKVAIPKAWANTRQPRTMIGHFSNGDLLFIVIDGRRQGWSNGVTLEEAQNKLLEFKVRDAYNLDGGGSSAFYYKGKILNRPSDGRERPVTSNIVILP
ncbi:phosphodiester glycosidase family protein [Brevibacillus sp. B_LB10_24]|uniref:phosphodiester glycosidase family protein n=1 Tax=Brevibacillus sp. B_LB10_24 TaxID=3380645 RepID=UPI0038B9E278